MKTLFIILMFAATAYAQEPPKICISQEAANKCASAAAELIEARNVIQKFQVERSASLVEREAATVLIRGLNDLILVKDRIEVEKDKVIEMYVKVVAMYQGIVADLEKRLMKPKSSWDKFLDAIKTVLTLAAGIALGRGF